MKVYNQIGSKERFLEMFEGVNKQKLNEAVTSGNQLVEKAFNQLKNKTINVEQTNTQTEGDKNYVEIITSNHEGTKIIFKFELNTDETVQDDVYDVSNAILSELKIKSPTTNVELPENMKAIQEFNAAHGAEILDVVSEYTSLGDDSMENDELYEEAIKLIDRVPYKKSTEEIQTNKAYADQKPTNPDLRVKSPELDKFVSENDAEDDMFALPPEYDGNDIPKADTDDGGIGQDPYDTTDVDLGDEDSQDDDALYAQAYDNLTNSGIQAPTVKQIEDEVLRMKRVTGDAEPFKKNRAISKDAEPFYESDITQQNFERTLTSDEKAKYIKLADEAVREELGDRINILPRENYIRMVKGVAMELFEFRLSSMNEEDKNYPDQIGTKFKPKGQFPKKKKKPQSVVNLGETENDLPDIDKLIGDKEETGDMISGGLADEKEPSDFDKEQLAIGLKVELEHSDNPMVALEIAMDHLTEDPEYYTRKDDPEASAQYGAAKDAEGDDEVKDELLGYKPHNVGDYTDESYASDEREYWDKEEYNNSPESQETSIEIGDEELNEDMDEYQGNTGDRYQDGEGNQFTVKGKVDGGVTLQGQGGEKEIATNDIQYLKKLSENTDGKKNLINEEQLREAKQTLNNRGTTTMTKKEAVQLLILNNIR